MRKNFFKLLIVFGICITYHTFGYNEADLNKLLKTKKCPQGNFSQATLSNKDLRETDLRYGNFEAAILHETDFRYADLRRANFSGADLA